MGLHVSDGSGHVNVRCDGDGLYPSLRLTFDLVLLRTDLIEVEQRIRSLTALKAELEMMVEGCGHGRVDQCRVIEVLADHGECMHPQH